MPITEDFPVGGTTNPYGTTKAFTERILQDVCKADPSLNVALLRFSVVGSRIHEILTCIKVVKAYNTEALEEEKYEEANNQTLKATLRSLRWGLLVGPAVETVGIFLICGFVVWCSTSSSNPTHASSLKSS